MNHITRIMNERDSANAEIIRLNEGMIDLLHYFQSEKFHIDKTAQVGDVMRRIEEIRLTW